MTEYYGEGITRFTDKLKKEIFFKWRKYRSEIYNLDFFGNEYYLLNGIFCIHITKEAKYRFGQLTTERKLGERMEFPNGYYVLSTRLPNYILIDDPDILQFILHFDLRGGKSLHDELKRRLGVDLTNKPNNILT